MDDMKLGLHSVGAIASGPAGTGPQTGHFSTSAVECRVDLYDRTLRQIPTADTYDSR